MTPRDVRRIQRTVPAVVVALVGALLTGALVAGAARTDVAPGDRLVAECGTGWTHVEIEPTTAVLRCAAAATTPGPSASTVPSSTAPTPTASVSSVPSAPASPTPSPTPTPTPTATPSPTVAPTAPPPEPASQVVGCGAATTGGAGGRIIEVDTYAELAAAVRERGPRIVRVTGDGILDGKGDQLLVNSGDLTIDGSGSSAIVKDAWISLRADNVILRGIRVRTGDLGVSADADAINLNGASQVVLDHVEAVWAPDVGGVTILNDSDNVTVQHSIIGGGLLRSSHPEALEDAGGHSYGFNIAGQGAGAPDCVTVYANLITTSVGRNPQVQGATGVDLVNNVIYNFSDTASGNPAGLNIVGNWYRSGPAPATAGVPQRTSFWRFRGSGDYPSVFSGSVYLADNLADGFTPTSPDAPAGSLRSTPAHPLSVAAGPVGGLLERVLADVGPRPLDARSLGWIRDVVDRSGTYWNGDGFAGPNPSWP